MNTIRASKKALKAQIKAQAKIRSIQTKQIKQEKRKGKISSAINKAIKFFTVSVFLFSGLIFLLVMVSEPVETTEQEQAMPVDMFRASIDQVIIDNPALGDILAFEVAPDWAKGQRRSVLVTMGKNIGLLDLASGNLAGSATLMFYFEAGEMVTIYSTPFDTGVKQEIWRKS